MTPAAFRRLALAQPDAVEGAHNDHPDFRVGGRIFASLSPPGRGWGMVYLPPEAQEAFCRAAPDVFEPFAGAWGRRGCTRVTLATAQEAAVDAALGAARKHVAAKATSRTSAKERSARRTGDDAKPRAAPESPARPRRR